MPILVVPTVAVHRSFLEAWDELAPEDLHWLGPVCIILGVIGFFAAEGGLPRHGGRLLIGLGLMLLALEMIIGASAPMRDAPELAALLQPLENAPLLAVVLFAVLTWLSHASLATILIAAGLARAGTIDGTLAVADYASNRMLYYSFLRGPNPACADCASP